jgi:very-short-patch-repair endonuclease
MEQGVTATHADSSPPALASEMISRLCELPTGTIQAVQCASGNGIADLVRAYGGADGSLRLLYLPVALGGSLTDAVNCLVDRLSELAEASWPYWFGTIDFSWFRDDALGNERLRDVARELAASDDRISPNWTTTAIRQVARSQLLRGTPVDPSVAATQLSLVLSPRGMILFLPFTGVYSRDRAAVAVAVVEWAARYTESVVVPIIPIDWPAAHPVDRLLFHAWAIDGKGATANEAAPASRTLDSISGATMPSNSVEISPIGGQPHPLSDVEKRMWAFLCQDDELRSLFRCNQTVETVHGSRPRVDLLWEEGKVIVELDGYPDHSLPAAFERDRHRDYQLLMSGYQVLRITNEEVNRDLEAAVGKIRDIVRWRERRGA